MFCLPATVATLLAILSPKAVDQTLGDSPFADLGYAVVLAIIFCLLGCLGIFIAWLLRLGTAATADARARPFRIGGIVSPLLCAAAGQLGKQILGYDPLDIGELALLAPCLPILCGFITALVAISPTR